MPIQVKCSHAECGKTLRVKDELAGKTIRCPGCQGTLKVPAAEVEPALAEAEEAEEAPVKPSKPAAAAVRKGAAPPPVPKAPAKAGKEAAVSAKAPAKKGGKAPPPDDDEPDPELEKLWEKSDMLNKHERLQVKKKMFSFWGAQFYINDPDTEEQVGIAKEKISIAIVLMRSVLKNWMGTNIEVRDEEGGPILFTVRKPMQWFSFVTTIEIYDQFAKKIGYFQTKLFSLTGGFWLYDADGEHIAEVKVPLLKPYINFLAADGTELARIANEAWEAKKFKVIINAGTNITLNEEVREHNNLKVLLLATVLAMEFTGVGKMKK